MKIHIETDRSLTETEIIIRVQEVNDEINNLVCRLQDTTPKVLTGFLGYKVVVLNEKDIIRVYSEQKKVFAIANNECYTLKMPLYEVMQRLNPNKFVRISHSETVNIEKVLEFDVSITGSIRIKLSNGTVSYVSRRFIPHIKYILGIGGKHD